MEDFLSRIFPRMFSGIAAFLFFLAISCFAIKHPKTSLYRTYTLVQRVWGAAFLQWALHLVVIIVFRLREDYFYASNILHLQSYFITLSLIGAGVTMLLSPNSNKANRAFFKQRILHIALFCTLSTVGILLIKREKMEILSICVMSIFFVSELLYLFIKFLKNYQATLRELDNYYAEDARSTIGWIRNSIVMATCVTLIAPLSLYAPTWYISGYSLLGIPCVFYLIIPFNNYRNYLVLLNNMEVETEKKMISQKKSKEVQPLHLISEKQERTQILVDNWLDKKGYTQNDLTIIEFAKSLGTNRTYMTQLINTKYGKSFREWIADLRIAYAKELLHEQPPLTITEIAAKAGFSSASYFTKMFTIDTGLSPKQWREDNLYNPDIK